MWSSPWYVPALSCATRWGGGAGGSALATTAGGGAAGVSRALAAGGAGIGAGLDGGGGVSQRLSYSSAAGGAEDLAGRAAEGVAAFGCVPCWDGAAEFAGGGDAAGRAGEGGAAGTTPQRIMVMPPSIMDGSVIRSLLSSRICLIWICARHVVARRGGRGGAGPAAVRWHASARACSAVLSSNYARFTAPLTPQTSPQRWRQLLQHSHLAAPCSQSSHS